MIIIGADWTDLLAWNLRAVGALWAAWAGGASTMQEAFDGDGAASIKVTASIDKPDHEKPRLLRLVP